MKILLANYRYFISGGPERYLFNLKGKLEGSGNIIIPFSVDYTQNYSSRYSEYFATPIGTKNQVYFDEHKKSLSAYIRTFSRLFYSKEVECKVDRLIEDHSPQIAYILHYLRKLSPSILVALKKRGIPIVVRLSDYGMICPQAHCLLNGEVCRTCLDNGLFASVTNKCVKNSLVTSLINYLATHYHYNRRFFDLIDTFVCTNEFMRQLMIEAGYSPDRLVTIPTFTDVSMFKPDTNSVSHKIQTIVYVGRIVEEKGVDVLIDAFSQVVPATQEKLVLQIAGVGDELYEKRCRTLVEENGIADRVEFLGKVESKELSQILSSAMCSVIPSIWYENLPNSLIESLACGTPVVASNIGSLSYCVTDSQDGLLFEPGSAENLAQKLQYLVDNPAVVEKMSQNTQVSVLEKYSTENHINQLMSLFNRLI